MSSWRRLAPLNLAFVCPFVFLAIAGCGQPSAEERLKGELAAAGMSKAPVFPLAGKVTIDGQAPQAAKARQRIIVMLNDMAKLDVPPANRLFVECTPSGEFSFSTYGTSDGVPAGKYVITVGQYLYTKKAGYSGPDGFKNLYNDPDKNAKNPELAIDHQSPGKTDYLLNLSLSGQEAATPGPNSIKEIPE